MPKRKRKLTAAEKKRRLERKRKFIVFINGKQKQVPRPLMIDGLTVEEFIEHNADPIWLHENGLWEMMPDDNEA